MSIIQQIEDLTAQANEAVREAHASGANWAEARNADAHINAQIRELILDELDYGFNDQVKSLLWSKAWEDGHSSGYTEILNVGYDLAAFLRDAIAASK